MAASDTDIEIDEVGPKDLKLKSAAELEGPDGEQNGLVYSDMLRQLQIRPDVQEDWFIHNLAPLRKKSWARTCIAKGDPASLRSCSDKVLTALGKLTWLEDRRWLIPEDQLDKGEQPLMYVMPGVRKSGDHDQFYPPMEAMWKEMRNRIFTLKRLSTPARDEVNPEEPKFRPHLKKLPKGYQRETAGYREVWTPGPASANEIVPPGKWSEGQSEEAILHIIQTLNNARHKSDEQIFQRVFQRFMARLEEIEYIEDLDVLESEQRPQQKSRVALSPTTTTTSKADYTTDVDVTTMLDLDESSIDELQADHYAPHPDTSGKKGKTSFDTKEQPDGPISSRSQAISTPISGSLLSYLPATYPQFMTAYITPYLPSEVAQPVCWLDAPCLPSSYKQFLYGVRFRANIPTTMGAQRLVIFLAYGWNNFCRVLRSEEDWKEGFQKDIMKAAERDRVDVWRMRVCCFAQDVQKVVSSL